MLRQVEFPCLLNPGRKEEIMLLIDGKFGDLIRGSSWK